MSISSTFDRDSLYQIVVISLINKFNSRPSFINSDPITFSRRISLPDSFSMAQPLPSRRVQLRKCRFSDQTKARIICRPTYRALSFSGEVRQPLMIVRMMTLFFMGIIVACTLTSSLRLSWMGALRPVKDWYENQAELRISIQTSLVHGLTMRGHCYRVCSFSFRSIKRS